MIKVVLIILLMFIGLLFGLRLEKQVKKEEIINNTNKTVGLSPDMLKVQEYFQKIGKTPYKPDNNHNQPKSPKRFFEDGYGDCDDKAVAFLDYLYNNGERELKLISFTHKSNKYGHACALWKGKIYDPTITPKIYNTDYEQYIKLLDKMGFNRHYIIPFNDNYRRRLYD